MGNAGTTIALLLLGVVLAGAHFLAYPEYSGITPTVAGPAMVLAVTATIVISIRRLRYAVINAWARLNRPSSDKTRLSIALAIFVVSASYLWVNAIVHDRDLTPRSHDENSYQIQARMMARGRLWMEQFPEALPDFFESFHLLVRPVYASIYFPGTALLYVPTVWLGTPMWLTAICITAAAASVLYLVAAELLGSGYGILASMMLVATPRVRWTSTPVLSHPPAMLAGLLILWTWMRWRKSHSRGWASALGAALGWAAIVRPFDLLAYAIPIGILFFIETRKQQLRLTAVTVLLMTLTAAPFVSLQFILNKGTTGRWLTTPYRSYIDQYQPGSALGFHSLDPEERPHTSLAQKLDVYDDWLRIQIDAHRLDNLWSVLMDYRIMWMVQGVLPNALLLALLPLGIVAAIRDAQRAAVVLVPFLFIALYQLNPYFVQHYPIVVAPAVILTVLFGLESFSAWKFCHPVALMFVVTATACIVPELSLRFGPELDGMNSLGGINQHLAERTEHPAVVLFRYQRGDNSHVEPVYNHDVAWPLDAVVIRAHDLGVARDPEIFRYFAEHDPARMFYLFDRKAMQLYSLGRARDWQEWFHPPKASTPK